jgi:PTH1 family peptidyl-tRNA hydrolase
MKEVLPPRQYQDQICLKAIAFLGNPGSEYTFTRHNVGWMFGHSLQWTELGPWQKKFKALYASGILAGQKIYSLYPLTFMNLSGESVRAFSDYFHFLPQDWLVVHDDIELEFGQVQLQKSGSLGGHNGLRSLASHLGTKDFFRLRIGIGRPRQGDVASFVLGRFTSQETVHLSEILNRATEIILSALQQKSF